MERKRELRIAWCPQHRGVMRISFFDPKPPHFDKPCPRCDNVLVEQIRNKYELSNPGAKEESEPEFLEHKIVPNSYTCPPGTHLYSHVCNEGCDYIFPDEVPRPAPPSLCYCCEVMLALLDNDHLCNWCVDCPTGYCDIPSSVLDRARNIRKNNAR